MDRDGDRMDGVNFHRRWDSEAFILQGESRSALIQEGRRLQRYLAAGPEASLWELAYALNSELAEVPYRLAIVASSLEDLSAKLERALERLANPACVRIQDRKGLYFFEHPLSREGKLAFLFPGEGAQYVNMLSDLCVHFPEMRACFDLIDRAFINSGRGEALPSQYIFPPPGSSAASERLWEMESAVAAVTTANRALLTLLSRLEVQPQAVLGHSTGEYTALQASGIMDLSDEARYEQYVGELKEIYQRAAVEKGIPRAMLVAVGADSATMSALLASSNGDIHIAMDNCPHQTVIAGREGSVRRAIAEIRQQGLIYEVLPFDRPYHTPLFEAYAERLRPFFERWVTSPPCVPLYSCTTMATYPTDLGQIRELALQHWVRPVQFRKTIEAMYADGVRIFVEVGPKGNLTAFVDDILRDRPHSAVALNVPSRTGIAQLNHAVALLVAQGVPMRLDYLYMHRAPRGLSWREVDHDRRQGKDIERSMKLELGLPILQIERRRAARTRPRHERAAPELEEKGSRANGLAEKPEREPEGQSTAAGPGQAPQPVPQVSPLTPVQQGRVGPSPEAARTSGARGVVLQAYFRTMERFLAAQEEVMRAFLTGNGAAPMPLQVAPTDVPASSAADDQALAAPPPAPQPRDVGSETSSIAPPPSSPMDEPPGRAERHEPPVTMGDAEAKAPLENVEDVLLRLVSEKTGYPLEMLDVTLNLEADLGIDSIKRVEILGALQRQMGAFEADELEEVAGLRTLQEMIDFLEACSGHPISPARRVDDSDGPRLERRYPVESLPFVRKVASLIPGEEAVVLREIDLDEDIFLRDHTLGGQVSVTDPDLMALPVMPLTMSMEVLAEAAALLDPHRLVVGMRDIHAHRWMAFEEKRFPLRMIARRQGDDEVRVELREDTSETGSRLAALPIVEGTVLFGDGYPEPPVAETLSFRSEQPFRWTPQQLYTEGMFHGPSFQGVVSADRWGEDGAEVTLQALPTDGLFRSRSAPVFLIDPVLLDAAGQLVGYWATERLRTGFNVFPFRVEALELYGPPLKAPERARCRARISLLGDARVRSDIDVITSDGHVRMRLVGWEDRRFDMPEAFYKLRISPRDVLLSRPWPKVVQPFQTTEDFRCCRLDGFPEGFFEGHGMIWQRVLAYLILSRRERELWRNLKGPAKRSIEWLLGRAAAKDAVRLYLRHCDGVELCPADIEIGSDAYGRPLVEGKWTGEVRDVPGISVSHSDGVAVAIAGPGGIGIGVDVERMGHVHQEEIEGLAFTSQERELLASRADAEREEWSLRLWCAKEAVAKALGRGMMGGPQALVARELDGRTGKVEIALKGKMIQLFPEFERRTIAAHTMREGDLIVASAIASSRSWGRAC